PRGAARPRGEGRGVGAAAGRGLGAHDGGDLGRGVGGQQLLGVDRLAPGHLDGDDLGTAAGGHVAHAGAEHAVDADDDGVARADDVDERRLHPGRAGAGDGQRHGVAGAEDRPQAVAGLVEQGHELGVEVAEHGPAEGLDRLGVGVAGPGAHEDTVGERHATQTVATGGASAPTEGRSYSTAGWRTLSARPSKMPPSDTIISSKPNRRKTATSTQQPPTMTSARAGSSPGLWTRSASASVASVRNTSSAASRVSRKWWMRSRS